MKNYTEVSRKITKYDNFIVSINEQLKMNQTVAMFFDEITNYRIGGLPGTTASELIGLEWPTMCVYTSMLNRHYQSWQIVATPTQTQQQMAIRNIDKGGVTVLPQGDYVELFLDIKENFDQKVYRLYISTKDHVIYEEHGDCALNKMPDNIVEASPKRIIFTDTVRNRIKKYLETLD